VLQSCTTPVSNEQIEKDEAIEAFKTLLYTKQVELARFARDHRDVRGQAAKAAQMQAQVIMSPILSESRKLLRLHEFDKSLFEGSGYDMDDDRVVFLALALVKSKELRDEKSSFSAMMLNACATPAYANSTWYCVKRAAGINVGIELLRNRNISTISGKKMLIRTFGKLATRFLGPIGTAIAVADFAFCMNDM